MTISIALRDPDPDSVTDVISPNRALRISIASDNPERPVGPTDVWVQGTLIISASSVLNPYATFEANGLLGYDVYFRPPAHFVEGGPIAVRVQASDGVDLFDDEWEFTVVDQSGPIVSVGTPSPFSEASASPATIDFTLSDALGLNTPIDKLIDFTVTDADAGYQRTGPLGLDAAANQIYSATADFRGREGATIDIGGSLRKIVSVDDVNLATYDGAQLAGTGLTAIVYQKCGLDVWVDNLKIIETGARTPEAQSAGWTVVITQNALTLDVSMTVPSPYAQGTRVNVGILAADDSDRVNRNEISYSFYVGNESGPTIDELDPPRSARGVSTSADIVFDITDTSGITLSSIQVEVNGVDAIVNGAAAAAPFDTSTVVGITDGYRITVTRTGGYTDGAHTFVDAQAEDANASPKTTRTTWILQHGDGSNTEDMTLGSGHLLDDDVTRVVAFDLYGSLFANPEDGHSGYGWDGYLYANGGRNTSEDKSTWHTELGDFPISGWIVFGPAGWSILRTDRTVFCSCASRNGSGWSMAANVLTPILDGGFGPDDAVLVVSCSTGIIAVDFCEDQAFRWSTLGREEGIHPISNRALDQASGGYDSTRTLTKSGPYSKIASRAWDRQLAIAAATSDGLAVAFEKSGWPKTASRNVSMDYVKLVMIDDDLLAVGNVSGQAHALLVSLSQLAEDTPEDGFFDDMSSPALPSGEAIDADMNEAGTIAVVYDDQLALMNGSTVVSRSDADLGLTGIADSSMIAVSLEDDTQPNEGYLYVATSSEVDGRVVRWREHAPDAASRSTVVSSGDPVTGLQKAGNTEFEASRYIRGFMRLA